MVQFSHPHMTTGKTIPLTKQTFLGQVMCLLFNMLSRLVIAFLPRSKRLLISWLQSSSTVILEPKKINSVTVSIVSPFLCHKVMRLDAMPLGFWMLSLEPAFTLLFDLHQRLFSSSLLSSIKWYHLYIWEYWYFSWKSWFQLVLHQAWCFAQYILHII